MSRNSRITDTSLSYTELKKTPEPEIGEKKSETVKSVRLRSLSSRVRDLLFPPACAGCGRLLPPFAREDGIFCADCLDAWQMSCIAAGDDDSSPWVRGEKGVKTTERVIGSGCIGHVYCSLYRPDRHTATEGLIQKIKRSADRRLFDFSTGQLAPRVLRALSERGIDAGRVVCVWVPRSRRAIRENGHDQSFLLARDLARACGMTLVSGLVRLRDGRAQKELGRAERKRSAALAYAVRDDARTCLDGKVCVLVDDLSTTGETLLACTRHLTGAGCSAVLWVTLAQTQKK